MKKRRRRKFFTFHLQPFFILVPPCSVFVPQIYFILVPPCSVFVPVLETRKEDGVSDPSRQASQRDASPVENRTIFNEFHE